MRGKVKFFDKQKGWGFITDSEGKDVFVHHSSIIMKGHRSLDEDDIVSFELGAGKDGRQQAVSVKPMLTMKMVIHELAKEGLHIIRLIDDKGKHGWNVVDESEKPVIQKEMDFLELAAFVGFDTEGLNELFC